MKFGNLTKFAFMPVSSIMYEKILYQLSLLSEKYDQKKTQFYIYLNIIDLCPVHDRKIRLKIMQKLLDHLNSYSILKIKTNKDAYSALFNHSDFTDFKIIRHKLRAIFNQSKTYQKNNVILIDGNLPFLKHSCFIDIIKNVMMCTKNEYYISIYDEILYVWHNEEYKVKDHDKSILKIGNLDDFLHQYKPIAEKFQLDIALERTLSYYKFKDYPKNNNFLYVFITIDSRFDFSYEAVFKLSQDLYQGQFSLFLCILNEEKIFKEEIYFKKLMAYRKLIDEQIINGQIFIINSFTLLKTILRIVSPLKFNEFDPIKFKRYMESLDLISNAIYN
jgi:hypothetical protein